MIQLKTINNISILRILITLIYGAIDDLYQKNARFSKLKLFFSTRSIRLSTVIAEMFKLIVIGSQ